MRRKIGDIEMTAVSDGPFLATLDTLIAFDRDEAQRLLGTPARTLGRVIDQWIAR